VENKEEALIINTLEGFTVTEKYIVIEYSDYNIDVITSNSLKFKIVEVVELEE